MSAVSVSPAVIARTPAINAYDLLRQTTGIEVTTRDRVRDSRPMPRCADSARTTRPTSHSGSTGYRSTSR
jgi:hypothetical protein